jgi:hypothetical protein
VRSFAAWVRIFGNYISETWPVWKHVKKFFEGGGTRLSFRRVVHYTDPTDPDTYTSDYAEGAIKGVAVPTAASVLGTETETFDITVDTNDTFKIDIDDDAGGAQEVVLAAGAGLTAAAVAADMQTKLDTAFGGKVCTVEADAGKIRITSDSTGTSSEVDIQTPSEHSCLTELGFTVGVTNGTAGTAEDRIEVRSKYHGAYYNDITLDIEEGSLGVAGEFRIIVMYDGAQVEDWDNLSLDTEADNYFVNIVNDTETGSNYVYLTDTTSTQLMDATQADVALTGGSDGTASLAKADYIGDPTAETGVEGFQQVDANLVIACPDMDNHADSVDVKKGIDAFIKNRHKTSFQVMAIPKAKSPTAAVTWQTTTLQMDSAYAALYYPWVVDADDGELISPVGAIMGLYGRYADDPNKGVWWSPAGFDAQLGNINGIEREVGAVNAGVLNENRINLIKIISGKGVTVYGSRTCAITRMADFRYIGARLNTSYVEKILDVNTRWAPQRPNNVSLWQDVTAVGKQILNAHWKAGGFDGATPNEAYKFVCNGDINTQATKNAGIVVVKVGILNHQTAEFLWFNISQLSSGAQVAE